MSKPATWRRRGFSLVEIMVALAILGLVAAFVIPVYSKLSTSAQVKSHASLTKGLPGVLHSYVQTYGALPIAQVPPAAVPIFLRRTDGTYSCCQVNVGSRSGNVYTVSFVNRFTAAAEGSASLALPLSLTLTGGYDASGVDALFVEPGRAGFDIWTAIRDTSLDVSEDAILRGSSLFSTPYQPDSSQTYDVRWVQASKAYVPYDTATGTSLMSLSASDVAIYRPILKRPALVGVRMPNNAVEGAGETAVFMVSGPVSPDAYRQLDRLVENGSAAKLRDPADSNDYNDDEGILATVDSATTTTYTDMRGLCTCQMSVDKSSGVTSGYVVVFVGFF